MEKKHVLTVSAHRCLCVSPYPTFCAWFCYTK